MSSSVVLDCFSEHVRRYGSALTKASIEIELSPVKSKNAFFMLGMRRSSCEISCASVSLMSFLPTPLRHPKKRQRKKNGIREKYPEKSTSCSRAFRPSSRSVTAIDRPPKFEYVTRRICRLFA